MKEAPKGFAINAEPVKPSTVREDLTGRKFGRLTAESLEYGFRNASGRYRVAWKCACECGKVTTLLSVTLLSGSALSCGCLRADKNRNRATHGKSRTPTFSTWSGILARCHNQNDQAFHNYGGRGIKVCDRWKHSFVNFMKDMGERPPGMTIERMDNDGDYTPENCRWASRKEQNRNRRSNRIITVNQIRRTVAEWSETTGISQSLITARIDRLGWTNERAVSQPARKTA